MKHLAKRSKIIFKLKLKMAKCKRSKDWTMSELDSALSKLKNNKSRDNDGFINEIFKKEVGGDNLKKSLLLMFNKLKQKNMIANFMNIANITTVPKKGSRLELKN